ncbi:L-2-amino-thiazoline-4-carboxylic acid hydrolase [Marinibaculum pumilum]|uniref:L-2-amino-thiazoline-4-carboxylic acid hydrolase n=1 Tax=Marinibaculum pumilum TaxID=1766165 RepID=A0ABV7L3X5_9PROT
MAADPAAAPTLPLLDEVKLQAKVLVPLIRSLRARLGKVEADRLVEKALRDWSRDLQRRIAAEKPGGAREKWDAIWDDLRPRIGATIDREMLVDDGTVREYNVTRCGYAEFFKDLGEPELGRFLLCDLDFDMAEVGAPDVEFRRTQTIMQGAPYCDFRYRFRRAGEGTGGASGAG